MIKFISTLYHTILTKTEYSKKYNKDELFMHIDFSYGLSNNKGEVEEYNSIWTK